MDTSKGRVSPPRQRMQLSWTDPRFRGLVWQVVVVGLVAGIIVWLWRNTVHNLDTRNISTGFGFLSREAGMPIAETSERGFSTHGGGTRSMYSLIS